MDNVIYTYYVYDAAKRHYRLLMCLLALLTIVSWIIFNELNFILLSIVTLFDVVEMYIDYLGVCNELIDSNKALKDKIMNNNALTINEYEIRCIQDCIINNRNKSLFITKRIRRNYLDKNYNNHENPYLVDLNQVKEKYMGKDANMPSNSDEIEVLSSDGKSCLQLSSIQKILSTMLLDVKKILDDNNIRYTLDGGTLIGAVRENGNFIPWDDDIDLAIKYEDFEQAKLILKKELSNKYSLQDYYNEEYYSPRLSNLRIRNNDFIVYEKDSSLFNRYKQRGIFLDIYVYAPILVNKRVDSIYRMVFIHPLHTKIEKIESKYILDNDKYSKIFINLKNKYIKRLKWYQKHAKCEEYYAYTPNYIENIKKPGPYILKDDLYKTNNQLTFINNTFPVPSNVDAVLEAFYGKEWKISPFISKEELIKNYGSSWYSHKMFTISKLKHISYIDTK